MSCYPSLETHPLKCAKLSDNYTSNSSGNNSVKVVLGPPDVYQQEPKQKEDLLTEFNVREGFNYTRPVADEHDSWKDVGFELISRPFIGELNSFMQAVIVKSHQNSIKPDTTKRKATVTTIFKDLQCIPALDKSKEIVHEWMVQLADAVPLAELINKRIPYFHKKEDVLKEIFRYHVPITRAIWFIKVSAMHATIQAESNKKKTRSNVDSSSDWGVSLTRTLQERLDAIRVRFHRNTIDTEYEMTVSEFEYLMRLMVAMYDDDLLEHTEVLQWLVTNNERCADDEHLMHFFLPFLMSFGDRFKESEILTRRLLSSACASLNSLLSPAGDNRPIERALTELYSEYSSCPVHRTVIFCLSGLVTSLALQCPSAVIYNNIKIPGHYLHGSPLDLLPCSLTALPSPPGPENDLNRETIAKLEEFVLQRSLAVDNQWKHESFECPIKQTASTLIDVLDFLDRFDYNSYKDANIIDGLSPIIASSSADDRAVLLMLLCEWAVSPMRTGAHRAIIIANIIENLYQHQRVSIQSSLIRFLDTKAPCIDSTGTTVDSESFRSLVCLFGELIEREIFSPNEYMSYMIARGLFESVPQLPLPPIGGVFHSINSTTHNTAGNNNPSRRSPELDKTSTDNPDSVRSECSGLNQLLPSMNSSIDYRSFSRHVQYLMHFPIPHNDDYLHEHNLRAQKLYSSSRTRDSNKQFLRRLAKDIVKLFSKRGYMFDIIQIEKVRRKTRRDPREESLIIDRLSESIQVRFKSLTYYDMECVLSHCLPSCVNSLNINSILANKLQSMSNMFLPYPKIINVLLSLIEWSCNYTSLIRIIDEFSANLIRLIEHFSRTGVVTNFSLVVSYCSRFRMCIIGFLLKYQSVLMFLNESRNSIFHSLFGMVRNMSSVGSNSPLYVNRCTFSLIHQLYQSCAILRSQPAFAPWIKKIESLFRMIKPDKDRSSSIDYIDTVAHDLLKNNAVSNGDFIMELQNSVGVRLSFVVNCILHIAHCTDIDQLARINTIIVETAASVPNLPGEWMTGIYSLLIPFNALPGYEPFVNQFNSLLQSNDLVFYENISTLIATLLARQCFNFIDFLGKVICVAMAHGIDQQSIIYPTIVPTTRLASYILFRLFTMEQHALGNSGANSAFKIEDINLLTSSLQKVTTELLVDLLKMLAVHSDKGRLQDQDLLDLSDNNQINFCPLAFKRVSSNHLHSLSLTTSSSAVAAGAGPVSLSIDSDESTTFTSMKIWNFTLRVLREICCVSWVRIKFSQETPSRLIRDNVLIDKNISNSQARNLLNIICHPKDHLWQTSCTSKDIIDTMNKTFKNLNLWSLHFDQMKIQLLLTQIPEEERKEVMENVSRDIINLFKHQSEANQTHEQFEDDFTGLFSNQTGNEEEEQQVASVEIHSAYLIPPLINKLPFENFKRQLVAAASEKLESGKHFSTHKNYQDKENDLQKSSSILTYPPFISLLMVCLNNRDDNKQDFLKSLSDQIEYYIDNAKETEKMPDDLRVKYLIYTSMRSRLALVGYLFDRIQESIELMSDWCLLLSKLIIYGVVEMYSDHNQLFYTVLDMFCCLIHTLCSQSSVGVRFSQTIKKIRKEICDKLNYEGVELIKPFLLPCFKNTYDIVVTVPLKMTHKSQQYRLTIAEKSGKQGCAVQRKERINPWEVIEGIKNLFSLSWFAAVGCDTPVLPIEEQANLMIGHDHPDKLIHPDSYYTRNPDIPHEDIKDSTNASESMMDITNTSGPPSVQNNSLDSSRDLINVNNPNNSNNNNNNNNPINNQNNVKVQECSIMQPQQRPLSNASSGVSTTKKIKNKKRSNQANNMNVIPPNHPIPRNVRSPAILPPNHHTIMRHPGGMPTMVPPSGSMGMSIQTHGYPGHAGMEHVNYQTHQLGPSFVDMPQHTGYMSRPHFAQNVYDSNRGNNMNLVRAPRVSRSNINETLKSKIQQRQPQQEPGIHGSFHNNPQQSIGLPPPYPSSANQGGIEDMNNVTPVPPPSYNSIPGNAGMMNNYSLPRGYSDPNMQQFMVQQPSRIHPQQYNRYNQF